MNNAVIIKPVEQGFYPWVKQITVLSWSNYLHNVNFCINSLTKTKAKNKFITMEIHHMVKSIRTFVLFSPLLFSPWDHTVMLVRRSVFLRALTHSQHIQIFLTSLWHTCQSRTHLLFQWKETYALSLVCSQHGGKFANKAISVWWWSRVHKLLDLLLFYFDANKRCEPWLFFMRNSFSLWILCLCIASISLLLKVKECRMKKGALVRAGFTWKLGLQ